MCLFWPRTSLKKCGNINERTEKEKFSLADFKEHPQMSNLILFFG